ncbi:SprT family zinc-dependent metalloprotease [Stenotrophomonas sp. MH1]|jgi:predicted metal-dependent hydrolase|uniref:SprT family zinc-dependent metalloprotease n=1 Tax=Stenotrophomonas capsici TaxID=3110230 RepID=A0ABU5V4J4_9GAMM|nr:SprT family zinc-dependent metalloprotease [Stenotrophomonas sp. MH1]MEA5667892.1 SprT family zinc-dependent metalloprotease [Stenotrophomonas sp. MH1]
MARLLRRLIAPTAPGIQRDTVRLRLDDAAEIEVLRVRDPRARRLKLSVDERGARLTLPTRASLVSGERFLQANRQWLQQQLARFSDDGLLAPPLLLREPGVLPLRGALLPVHWEDGRFTRIEVDEAGAHIQLSARAGEAALRRALREFYEAQTRADVGQWLPKYLPGLARAPARLRLKVMSSQWGSLAPDGSMALDLALVLGRPSAFEYVLVHELCHLLQANHSPAFWAEVQARFPHWEQERDYLRLEGRRLKGTLHQLLQVRA